MRLMTKNPAINDGLILLGCIILSSIIIYFVMGVQATLWGATAVLHAYNLFNKPKDYKNYFYTFIWSIIILVAIYLGHYLKLGHIFYLFLIILSFFYFQLYGLDPTFDLSMKYMIVFSTIGTILAGSVIKDLTIGLLIGTIITLLVCYSLSDKPYIKIHINRKQIQSNLFQYRKNIFPRSLIYSAGLILCLLISNWLKIGHFYWALLTFVFVLHPKSQSIIKLTAQRIIGSLLVVLMLFFLFNTPFMPYIGILSILGLAFFLPMSNQKSYIFASFCTTGFILAVIEMSQYWQNPSYQLFSERILETLLGSAIAIIFSIFLQLVREK